MTKQTDNAYKSMTNKEQEAFAVITNAIMDYDPDHTIFTHEEVIKAFEVALMIAKDALEMDLKDDLQ